MGEHLRAFASHHERPHGLRFRHVVDADYPFLNTLYADTRAAEMALVSWSEDEKAKFLASQFALQDKHYRNVYRNADFLVVEQQDRPIGRVYVNRSDREIRLMEITLVPESRNRGLGSALLHELMDEARSVGAQLTLHIEPHNPAQRLYRRLGFYLIENRGAYDFLGWRPSADAPISGEAAAAS
jgi:ribosomal protein S18 acetylase RimI-like enzyme